MRNLLLTLIFGLLAFTGFSQIQLVGNITTFGGGSYPTHIDSLGYGGLTVVADATERDAITQLRRKIGMVVFQVDESQLYYLDAPITENNWVPIETGVTAIDTTQTTIYCPAHGLDLTDYEGEFLPMFACRGAQADHIDSLQTYYAVSIPHVDSITIIASGLIYRPAHNLADFIGKIVYLTNTVGAYDTIQGTVLSAIAVVIDSNYIDLLPRSVLESENGLFVLPLPASFLNAYMGDSRVPQDTAVQRIARLYANVGLLRAGGKVITQSSAISDNPIYTSTGANPVNPGMSWTWTGGVNGRVIKDKELLVAIDLADDTYGGLDITPLDTVVLVGGVPTDTTVFNWLEDNVTNRNLRLPNGSLLYFVGNGSRQNPDYIWTVMDDLSGNLSGTTRWSRLIKRVKEPAQSLDNPVIGTGTAGRFAGWASTDSLTNFPLLFGTGAVTLDAGLGFRITGGTTASRPTGAAGMMYWNTSNNWFDFHNGTSWFNPARSATTNGLFTAGSWLFAASDGTVTQNNSNFFVDNSNIRVGIGTNAPGSELEIYKSFNGITSFAVNNPTNGTAARSVFSISSVGTTGSNGISVQAFSKNYTSPAWGGGYIAGGVLFARYATNTTDVGRFAIANVSEGNGAKQISFHIAATSILADANKLAEFTIDKFEVNSKSGDFDFQVQSDGDNANIWSDGALNAVGIGTSSPDRKLHAERSGSSTNTVTPAFRITEITSATAAAGLGTGMEYEVENASGTNRVIGQTDAIYTTATNAAEVSDLVFRTMNAGVLGEKLRVLGNGTLQVGTLTGTATQMVGATAGNILCPITLGAGLSFSSGTLNGAFLPLTLTGNTTVNTAGNQLTISDADTYPYLVLSSTAFEAGSAVGTLISSAGADISIRAGAAGGDIELEAVVAVSVTAPYLSVTNDGTETGGVIRLLEGSDNGTNYAIIKAPDALGTNPVFEVPATNGSSGQFLQTDGSGATSWQNVSGDGNGIISALPLGNVVINNGFNYLQIGTSGVQYSHEGLYALDALTVYSQDRISVEADNGMDILAEEEILINADYISYRNDAPAAGAVFRMREASNNGVNYVSVEAPALLAANTRFVHPATNGTAGQLLRTDGTGITSWQTDANGLISALPAANTDIITDYTLGLEDSGGERLELNSLGINIVSIADDASLQFSATGIDFISGSGAAFGISSQEAFSLNTTNDNISFNAGSGIFQVTASTINMAGTLNANSNLAVTGTATFRGAAGAAGEVSFLEPLVSGTNTHTLRAAAMAANMVTYLPTSAPTTENGVWERDAAGNTILRATVHTSISGSTDASGDITVSHSNDDGTFNVSVQVTGTTYFTSQVHSKTSSDFKVRFFDAAGSPVITTAVTADYTLTDI